jgi:hypothetical protein
LCVDESYEASKYGRTRWSPTVGSKDKSRLSTYKGVYEIVYQHRLYRGLDIKSYHEDNLKKIGFSFLCGECMYFVFLSICVIVATLLDVVYHEVHKMASSGLILNWAPFLNSHLLRLSLSAKKCRGLFLTTDLRNWDWGGHGHDNPTLERSGKGDTIRGFF